MCNRSSIPQCQHSTAYTNSRSIADCPCCAIRENTSISTNNSAITNQMPSIKVFDSTNKRCSHSQTKHQTSRFGMSNYTPNQACRSDKPKHKTKQKDGNMRQSTCSHEYNNYAKQRWTCRIRVLSSFRHRYSNL